MDHTVNCKTASTQRLKSKCYCEKRLFTHLPFLEKLEGTPKWIKQSEMTQNMLQVLHRFAVIYDDESNKISGSQTKNDFLILRTDMTGYSAPQKTGILMQYTS